jgi:hypothetical protein
MINQWGNKARSYYREYRPGEYRAIPNKEAFFQELGEAAETQFQTVYQRLRNPELGDNDPMARMGAEETLNEMLFPGPEPGHEDGWESEIVSDEEYQRLVETNHPNQDQP